MVNISDYDEWKTDVPEEDTPECICDHCGSELYGGDYIYTISGENICEDCMNDMYRKML